MISNTSEKWDSMSGKNIKVNEILAFSGEKINQRFIKKHDNTSFEYGTDQKKKSTNQSYLSDLQQMRAVIQSCELCMQKIQQFTTIKPKQNGTKTDDKSIQTINNATVIDKIQQRAYELCAKNKKLSHILVQKKEQAMQRQNQIFQIQDKFTNILQVLGQEISYLTTMTLDAEELRQVTTNTQTPSYLKAMMMEGKM